MPEKEFFESEKGYYVKMYGRNAYGLNNNIVLTRKRKEGDEMSEYIPDEEDMFFINELDFSSYTH